MTAPISFTRSQGKAFVRSPGWARIGTRGPYCTFQSIAAMQGLWGFGTFNNLTGSTTTGSEMTNGSLYGPNSTRFAANLNTTWPAVYNTLTEVWTEAAVSDTSPYPGFPGGTQTITTSFSKYSDQAQPNTPGVVTTGSPYLDGTITSITITASTITINYTFNYYDGISFGNPLHYVVCSGTYVGTLSGSLLDPGGTGPFSVTDPTYGWEALTAITTGILAAIPMPTVNKNGCSWEGYQTISTGGFTGTNGGTGSVPFATPGFGGFSDGGFAGGATIGMPASTTEVMINQISDVPSGSPTGLYASPQNHGYCFSSKSIWYFGSSTWQDTSFYTGYNTVHTEVYAQTIAFPALTSGSAAPASTFSHPIPVGTILQFDVPDVLANIGGSGNYGMIGFVSAPA